MRRFENLVKQHIENGICNPADLSRDEEWTLVQTMLADSSLETIQRYMGQIPGAQFVAMTLPGVRDETAYTDIQDGLMSVCRLDIVTLMSQFAPADLDSTPDEDDGPHWEDDAREMFKDLVR